MRPESLFPFFKPVTSIKGIGPRLAVLVEKASGPHVIDLCWHLPSAIIDRRYAPPVADARPGLDSGFGLRPGHGVEPFQQQVADLAVGERGHQFADGLGRQRIRQGRRAGRRGVLRLRETGGQSRDGRRDGPCGEGATGRRRPRLTHRLANGSERLGNHLSPPWMLVS